MAPLGVLCCEAEGFNVRSRTPEFAGVRQLSWVCCGRWDRRMKRYFDRESGRQAALERGSVGPRPAREPRAGTGLSGAPIRRDPRRGAHRCRRSVPRQRPLHACWLRRRISELCDGTGWLRQYKGGGGGGRAYVKLGATGPIRPAMRWSARCRTGRSGTRLRPPGRTGRTGDRRAWSRRRSLQARRAAGPPRPRPRRWATPSERIRFERAYCGDIIR